ncbi:MAG: hypothetical protein R2877_02380 [Bdellovibrionota bacterium]
MKWLTVWVAVWMLGATSVGAQYTNWESKSKDEFDMMVERINSGEPMPEEEQKSEKKHLSQKKKPKKKTRSQNI